MSERPTAEFDAIGLPVDCGEPHPVTGNGCVEPRGHDGLHRAMGAARMQGFGAEAACVTPPERSVIWEDHERDMQDPEYRKAFEEATRVINAPEVGAS